MSDLIRHTTELAMHIVSGYVRPGDIVIDATCGNGQDTLRLARMEPSALFAFDVQQEALRRTEELLRREGFLPGRAGSPAITLTCLGHEHMADFFARRTGPGAGFASAVVFNLGYLPGGDKSRTTKRKTTLAAVQSGLSLLKEGGLLCATMYSGHPEGADEKRALLAFAEGLDPKLWHVCLIGFPNQKNHPPEILLISRKFI